MLSLLGMTSALLPPTVLPTQRQEKRVWVKDFRPFSDSSGFLSQTSSQKRDNHVENTETFYEVM